MGQPPDDRNHEAVHHRRTGRPARPDQKPVRPAGREDGLLRGSVKTPSHAQLAPRG